MAQFDSVNTRFYHRFTLWLCCLILASAPVYGSESGSGSGSAKTDSSDPHYVGSQECASCHQEAYRSWRQSHHWQAMQEADASTVLGDFDNASFKHFGITSSFYQKDNRYYVRTDNAAGEMQDFPVTYTFGIYPLQQYLIGFDDGRYQALSVAWDSRPADQGGQRWFHLYPDEAIPHTDPLHWTGAFQNWNSRCAVCHSTNLQKGYSQKTDSYQTTWSEINVGCEACHGQGSKHLAWANGDQSNTDKGWTMSLAERGTWEPSAGHTAKRKGDKPAGAQLAACGACHARRQQLTQPPQADKPFLDQYIPSLLLGGLYFPDGQIEDEVYVYGSFVQSKMHAEGVVCSNCHEPHSLALKAQGNALCTQCHQAGEFDSAAHHHHPVGSRGAQCANCHMPERTYMVVDPRRDHSFKVPQPILSGLLGTPNACQTCHQDRDNAWAQKTTADWYGHQPLRDEYASTLAIARRNSPAALEPLIALANDDSIAPIIRATAVMESGRFSSPLLLKNAIEQLYSDDALIRVAAVRSLLALPIDQRYQLLQPLIGDPVKAVRITVAGTLAAVDDTRLGSEKQRALELLFKEYLTAMAVSADMPSTQLNLGLYYTDRGDYPTAISAYQHSLKLAPNYIPALLNLADLYRILGQNEQAKPLLKKAIAIAPDQAPAYHSLGLLLVRQQQLSQALPYLEKAARLDPGSPRYGFVYGVALHSSGQVDKAIETLKEAAREHPYNQQIQGALKSYESQGK